jgi:hypothetical protein
MQESFLLIWWVGRQVSSLDSRPFTAHGIVTKATTAEARRRVLETYRKTSLLLEDMQPTLVPWAVKDGTVRQLFEAAVARTKKSGQLAAGEDRD